MRACRGVGRALVPWGAAGEGAVFRDPGKIAKSYPAKIGSRAAAARPFPGKINAQIAASRFYCGVLRAISEESPWGGPRTVAVGRGAARNFGFNSCRKI